MLSSPVSQEIPGYMQQEFMKPLMLRPSKHLDIVSERLGPLNEHVAGHFCGFGCPRQNP